MMPADHGTIAAATGAGWVRTATDRGAGYFPSSERHHVVLEKHLVGASLRRGGLTRQEGFGATSADADTQALAGANYFRRHRYGAGTAVSTSQDGSAHTVDAS